MTNHLLNEPAPPVLRPDAGFRWTPETLALLCECVEAGERDPQVIGLRLGAPASVVAAKLMRGDYHVAPFPSPARLPPQRREGFSWSDANEATLRRMWSAGDSASVISRALPGSTRSGVLGKVHRLDLPGRLPGTNNKGPRAKRAPGAPRQARSRVAKSHTPASAHPWRQGAARQPARVPIEQLVPPACRFVSLMALALEDCKWPVGEPGTPGFGFCGARQFTDLPYCEYHSRLAYVPMSDRQRARDKRI